MKKIGTKLMLGYLAVAFIALLIGMISWGVISHLNESISQVTDYRIPKLQALAALNKERMAIRAHTLDIWIEENSEHEVAAASYRRIQQERATSWTEVDRAMDGLARLPARSEAEQRLLTRLQQEYRDWRTIHRQIDLLITRLTEHQSREERATLYDEYRVVVERLLPTSNAMGGTFDELSRVNTEETTRSALRLTKISKRMEGVIALCVLIGVALALGLGFTLSRNITVPLVRLEKQAGQIADGNLTVELDDSRRADEIGSLSRSFEQMVMAIKRVIADVQRSGLQVNSAVVELSATTKEQQSTASEVAGTTAEISATAKEMSATSTDLLRIADEVSRSANQAGTMSAEGKTGLERIESILQGILEAGTKITARLGLINEKAGNINTLVTTISKVADQTNLLSLNAAIEAEKAGEYGKGFSVVAGEIRRLADQTAASTSEIEQTVKEMVSAVSSGVMGMDTFSEELRRGADEIRLTGTRLDRIVDEVQSLAPSVENVHEGLRSQTLGAQQISEALAQLGEAARLSADSTREINNLVEQLSETAEVLKNGISKFTVDG